MTRNRTIAAQIALILALSVAAFALAASRASASEGHWRYGTVGLGDATSAPTELSLLRPGRSITYAHGTEGWNCVHGKHHGWFSDVQAYAWNGTAIGRQHFNPNTLLDSWRVEAFGRVTFDGITFRNRSSVSVLVAGWCE